MSTGTHRPHRPHIHSLAELAEALYMSTLQESDRPTPEQVRSSVAHVLACYGEDCARCAGDIAWQYGHDPIATRDRMQWARGTVAASYSHTIAVELFTRDLQAYTRLKGRHRYAIVERHSGIVRSVLALSSRGHGYGYLCRLAQTEATHRGAALVARPNLIAELAA